ncbi:Hypp5416 [Branchiostoma lanceolatum]|uniref:Hypp5416 protein n=1 Tax=Branchiostoma lanceolatum TaxID=7740 RepID=A0A8K0AFV2_BRALA|nr:Hypp5416 [Branchiostoma lanceolatum]
MAIVILQLSNEQEEARFTTSVDSDWASVQSSIDKELEFNEYAYRWRPDFRDDPTRQGTASNESSSDNTSNEDSTDTASNEDSTDTASNASNVEVHEDAASNVEVHEDAASNVEVHEDAASIEVCEDS